MTDLLTVNFADHWVVDPVAELAGVASVSIVAGQIVSVTWRDGEAAARACWAAGANPGPSDPTLALLPALIDLHAHFRQPGANASEDVESGTRAAAHGGYGTVALMPNTEPAADSVNEPWHILFKRHMADPWQHDPRCLWQICSEHLAAR